MVFSCESKPKLKPKKTTKIEIPSFEFNADSAYSYIEKQLGIINIKWILLILLFVIFLEMFLRRFNGLV